MRGMYSRLADHVKPTHYDLKIIPNLEEFSFSGSVDITVEIREEVSEIVINSLVRVSDVTVRQDKCDSDEVAAKKPKLASEETENETKDTESLTNDYSEDVVESSFEVLDKDEVIIVKFDEPVEPCKLTISINFSGVLDDSMRGFYRTSHNVAGVRRWGAACHFEATGARKCFPCFDQPEFRSTFDISITRPHPHITVLSNMTEETRIGDVICFNTTPPMPSYLVCFICGYYDSISAPGPRDLPVTVFTPQGESDTGRFALEVAVKALDYFEEFFSTPFTLPKIDLVAVPDFYIGAMENWGLLTFRETSLLFERGEASTSSQQYVSILVTHEVAHQWFGNLVGVEWWDQLWLKEGFATWISFLAVDKIFPEFDIWSQFLTSEKLVALDLDGKKSSHPIEIPDGVTSPAQIDEIFDEISYSKGASIINMLYHWVGRDKFSEGMSEYLSRHQGTSASNLKLWNALEHVTNLPVGEVMNDWIKVQGFPLVNVSFSDGKLSLKQENFENFSPSNWKIPLKITVDNSNSTVHILESREADLELGVASDSDDEKIDREH